MNEGRKVTYVISTTDLVVVKERGAHFLDENTEEPPIDR
jgi:hypothetical protein